jgi:acyl carrier protein
MVELLRREIAVALGMGASRIEPVTALADLGLDSLMSVEVEAGLEAALGVRLPFGYLLQEGVTLLKLAERVLEEVRASNQ